MTSSLSPSRCRLFRALGLSLLVLVVGACDAGTGKPGAQVAPASSAAACPATDIAGFVAAFADDQALQRKFTAPMVDTAFVDMSAQPEPAESVEPMSREKLHFPVIPSRATQQREGLRYREVGTSGDRTTVVLEKADSDAQLRYVFRRDAACWTLVKIVDPAFGKAFPGAAAAPLARQASTSRQETRRIDGSGELSAAFTECMSRAGTQDIARADCLSEERDRQDARLNKVYAELIGRLEGPRRDKVVEAQRVWLQLQQKDGAFEASVLDDLGPMGNLQSVEYEARALAQRANLLEKYLGLSKL